MSPIACRRVTTPRIALAFLLVLLPGRLRHILARRLLGWEVHPTARIGRSVVVADEVYVGPNAAIGSGNVIKGLAELRLDEGAVIGSLNWISGPPLSSGLFPHSPRRHPALLMRGGAAITARHIIDCSDTVTFEKLAILSGIRSTIFTHSVNLVRNQQRTGRVTIGERSAVLTNSLVLAGTAVAPRSIVSAGSVITTPLVKEHVIYRGNPAVEIRDLPEDLAFFRRESAWTD